MEFAIAELSETWSDERAAVAGVAAFLPFSSFRRLGCFCRSPISRSIFSAVVSCYATRERVMIGRDVPPRRRAGSRALRVRYSPDVKAMSGFQSRCDLLVGPVLLEEQLANRGFVRIPGLGWVPLVSPTCLGLRSRHFSLSGADRPDQPPLIERRRLSVGSESREPGVTETKSRWTWTVWA
jgi:hypothetical protein